MFFKRLLHRASTHHLLPSARRRYIYSSSRRSSETGGIGGTSSAGNPDPHAASRGHEDLQHKDAIFELLRIADQTPDLRVTMGEFAQHVRTWLGLDAVGIRLRDGEDFPYYATSGFPDQFLRAENYLCSSTLSGELIRDSDGSAALQCMCGHVICRRCDPSESFFTKHGAFWTNSTSQLANDEASDNAYLTGLRGECARLYESVALIPLSSGDITYGLLHLCDARAGVFSPELISVMEGICRITAYIVAEKLAGEALRRNEMRNLAILNAVPDLMFTLDRDGTFLDTNRDSSPSYYVPPGICLGRTVYEVLPQHLADLTMEHIKTALETGEIQVYDYSLELRGEVRVFETRMFACCESEVVSVNRDVTEYRRAEEALRRTQLSMDRAADAVFWIDANGRYFYANESASRLTGYTRDELLAMHVYDINPMQTPESWAAIWEKLRSLDSATVQSMHRTKGGKVIPVEIHANFLEFNGAEFVCSFIRDISQRRRVSGLLAMRARQQSMIAEIGQMALGGMEVGKLLEVCTVALSAILGVEYTIVAKCIDDCRAVMVAGAGWKEGAVGTAIISVDVGTQGGYTLASSQPVVVADLGKERRFSEPALLSEYGVVSGMSVAIRGKSKPWGILAVHSSKHRVFTEDDAHFLQAAANILTMAIEQDASASVLRMQTSAINAARDLIVITDLNGVIAFVNPAFEKTTGYSRDEMVGQNISVIHEPIEHANVWQTIFAGGIFQGEMNIYRKDGSLCIVDVSVTPVIDESQSVVHVVAVLRDITERYMFQEQLNQARKLETVGKLAAGIAHDFNNLLQMILGYTHILLETQASGSDSEQDLWRIETACTRATDLIRQILTFSRQVPTHPATVDMAAIAKETARLLRGTFPRTISIRCRMAETSLFALADASQIHQVLMNLCINARDAMPDGGLLKIAVDRVTLDKDFVSAHPWARVGDFIRCTVSDNGVGMDEETRRRAFEPFFTTKPTNQGSGLGLSTCFGIVRNHDGLIDIESHLGHGTTVAVFLPVAESPKSIDTPSLHAEESDADATILLVDDEEYIRDFMARILGNAGYKVILAQDGQEAIAILDTEHERISLMLLDLNMPNMDGMRVLSIVRKMQPSLKVLVTTGLDMGVEHLPAHERPQGFLQKPYTPAALLKSIRELLQI